MTCHDLVNLIQRLKRCMAPWCAPIHQPCLGCPSRNKLCTSDFCFSPKLALARITSEFFSEFLWSRKIPIFSWVIHTKGQLWLKTEGWLAKLCSGRGTLTLLHWQRTSRSCQATHFYISTLGLTFKPKWLQLYFWKSYMNRSFEPCRQLINYADSSSIMWWHWKDKKGYKKIQVKKYFFISDVHWEWFIVGFPKACLSVMGPPLTRC